MNLREQLKELRGQMESLQDEGDRLYKKQHENEHLKDSIVLAIVQEEKLLSGKWMLRVNDVGEMYLAAHLREFGKLREIAAAEWGIRLNLFINGIYFHEHDGNMLINLSCKREKIMDFIQTYGIEVDMSEAVEKRDVLLTSLKAIEELEGRFKK
jgi:hypothetical protein